MNSDCGAQSGVCHRNTALCAGPMPEPLVLPFSDISTGPTHLSQSRVSSEASCSRREIGPLISGGLQYLLKLKINPTMCG